MSHPKTVAEWAQFYLDRGLAPVVLKPKSKECSASNWKDIEFKAEDFEPGDNIGIKSFGGINIVDVDCPEAVACASDFLPATGAIYGRKSKPRSKWVYRSTFEKTIALKDTDAGDTLIEIRANHQDMAPPSMHPNGETLAWTEGSTFELATVEATILLRAVRLIATTALVSRYYNPSGNRHEWCLAMAGTLRQMSLTEAECVKVITAAARWANDGKLEDRLTEVKSTYNRPDDEPAKGPRALIELMDRGKPFTKSIQKIWGQASGTFLVNEKGQVIKCQENIKRALKKLDIHLSFDTFSEKPRIKWGKLEDTLTDQLTVSIWLLVDRKYNFLAPKELFYDVVMDTAREKPFHPVIDYLKGLKHDGKPRLERWLIDGGGAGDSPYTRAVSRLTLCAAVKRVVSPGCKFDEMLILESGTQGLQKSTALRTLCPNEEWFSDDLPLNVEAKQIVERTAGKWIVEASDLSGMGASQVEHLKAMLSRQVDGPVRMAYARMATERKRTFIIVGTTNDYNYLVDLTGNRRFWPVRIERFDIEWLLANRDQLWAEAYALVTAGASIRLPPDLYQQAEVQQQRRLAEDPWEEVIQGAFEEENQRLTPFQVWETLGIPVERRSVTFSRRLARVMQKLGYRPMSVKDENKQVVKGWARGDSRRLPFGHTGREAFDNPHSDDM